MTPVDTILLVKYDEDFNRGGSLDGMFFMTKTNWDRIIGRRWYASEALGKYSEVYGEIGGTEFWKTSEITLADVVTVCTVLGVGIPEKWMEEYDATTDRFDNGPGRIHVSGFDMFYYLREND